MTILQKYMARLFLVRWGLVAFGLAALVLVFDLLANSDSVIEVSGARFDAFIRYIYLRFPIIFVRIFSFSILLAALMTLIELTVRRELVAMMAAGASQLNFLLAFLPVALGLTVLQFVVADQISTRAISELKAWGVGQYKSKSADGDPVWIRDGERIIRIGSARRSGDLKNLTIFRRDPDGNVVEKIDAGRAVFEDGKWWLEDVRRHDINAMRQSGVKKTLLQTSLTPSAVLAMASDPRDLTLRELARFAGRTGFGNQPGYVYRVWLQRKFTQPFVIVVIFLLVIPLVQRFQRRDGAAFIVFVGVIGGFMFFAFDGRLVSMGTAGLLPPAIAAWGGIAIFGLVGLTMAVYRELL